jgi:hypothetical protein
MDERAPADGIRRHRQAIGPLSDDELIARIKGTEPLPDADNDDPAWLEDATWDRAEFLLAAADAIGERRLRRAIAPLFQRATLGDAYEMMQKLRHGPERAAALDWQALTGIMRPLTRHHRAGCAAGQSASSASCATPRPWTTCCRHWQMSSPSCGPRPARA